jgi:hypothetical protein
VNKTLTVNGNGVTLERNASVTRLRLFYVSPTGNLTLNDVTLQNGKALGGNGGSGGRAGGGGAGLGGAIFNEGTLAINRSTLTANTAQGGAGGSGSGSQGSGGGGMGEDGGAGGGADGANGGGPNGGLGSTVSGGSNNLGGFGGGTGGLNTAGGGGAGFGGAVFNNYQGVVTITNSTFSANTVTAGTGIINGSAQGSGLFNRNGAVTIINSTFNDSVYNLGAANADNPGGASRSGGSLTIVSTIITTCNNNSGAVTGPLANRNLIQNNSGCDTPALTSNPQLAPLGNNGGQTPTHALLNGSPAIDAGSNSVTGAPYNLTTDQRGAGFPRQINSAVDIGAFEFLPPNTAPTFTSVATPSRQKGSPASNSQIATVGDAETAAGSLTVAVISANPSNGVTISSIANTNGAITADIVASCAASNGRGGRCGQLRRCGQWLVRDGHFEHGQFEHQQFDHDQHTARQPDGLHGRAGELLSLGQRDRHAQLSMAQERLGHQRRDRKQLHDRFGRGG